MPRVTRLAHDGTPLLWRMFPTWTGIGAVSVPDADADRLEQRGWLKVNGERAVILARIPEDCGRVAFRVMFDRKFPYLHP